MIICAYQFPVSANINENCDSIRKGITSAAKQSARLLIFPECALTGYPTNDHEMLRQVSFTEVEDALREFDSLSKQYHMDIVCGSIEKTENGYYNSAILLSPDAPVRTLYRKRALWGWDKDHFLPGKEEPGVVEIDGFRIGIRICFEIRFPEYFRELYLQNVDCAAILFCDQSEEDDLNRYELIRSHIRTRAVENTYALVSVNSCGRYQTAPSMAVDKDGKVISELLRNEESLLVFDLHKQKDNSFGTQGRKYISDRLLR